MRRRAYLKSKTRTRNGRTGRTNSEKTNSRTLEPRTLELEPEPQVRGHRTQRPHRRHLAEGRTVAVGVDACEVHVVQQIRRVEAERQRAIAAHPDVARELRVQLFRARTDDDVATS